MKHYFKIGLGLALALILSILFIQRNEGVVLSDADVENALISLLDEAQKQDEKALVQTLTLVDFKRYSDLEALTGDGRTAPVELVDYCAGEMPRGAELILFHVDVQCTDARRAQAMYGIEEGICTSYAVISKRWGHPTVVHKMAWVERDSSG